MSVDAISFSAHADFPQTSEFIDELQPRHALVATTTLHSFAPSSVPGLTCLLFPLVDSQGGSTVETKFNKCGTNIAIPNWRFLS